MKRKLELLKQIASQFNREGITWALGASMLLYFKQIVSEFHDIDLLVANEDAVQAKYILDKLGHRQPPKPNEKYASKEFLEYDIDGIDVDLMVGFAIKKDNEVHDCSLSKSQITEYFELDGVRIPLQSVELWHKYYLLMDRADKVALIEKYCR